MTTTEQEQDTVEGHTCEHCGRYLGDPLALANGIERYAAAKTERLRARVEELEGALKPFAEVAAKVISTWREPYTESDGIEIVVSVREAKRARAALSKEGAE